MDEIQRAALANALRQQQPRMTGQDGLEQMLMQLPQQTPQPTPMQQPAAPMPTVAPQVQPQNVLPQRQDLLENLMQQLRGGPRPNPQLPGGVRG